MNSTRTPVVFIHDLWLHPASWQPWLDRFTDAGYAPVAPGWPGVPATVEQARADPDSVAGYGIDDATEHFAGIVGGLPAPAVIIGHAFGDLIAQKLLGEDLVAAAIAIDSAPVKDVLPLPPPALRSALPVFSNLANARGTVSLSADQFRSAFGNAVSPQESDALYEKWAIPGSGRALREEAEANFSPHSPAGVDTSAPVRGPLLLIMGGQDQAAPEAVTKVTFKQYRGSPAVTDLAEFADRGHSLTIDSGWRAVAGECLSWLAKQGM
jgi:alpha-beta hydrolase superfamily lysophospholipase